MTTQRTQTPLAVLQIERPSSCPLIDQQWFGDRKLCSVRHLERSIRNALKISLVPALLRWQDKSGLAEQLLTAISAEKREEAATATSNGVVAANAAKGQIEVFASALLGQKKVSFADANQRSAFR